MCERNPRCRCSGIHLACFIPYYSGVPTPLSSGEIFMCCIHNCTGLTCVHTFPLSTLVCLEEINNTQQISRGNITSPRPVFWAWEIQVSVLGRHVILLGRMLSWLGRYSLGWKRQAPIKGKLYVCFVGVCH